MDNLVLLGKAKVADAQALRDRFKIMGVELSLVHNAATCTSGGCAVQVEVWARGADQAVITATLAAERQKTFDAMGYDGRLAEEVFDPSRTEAVCPACATTFATTVTECPECGLCFAAGGGDAGGCG